MRILALLLAVPLFKVQQGTAPTQVAALSDNMLVILSDGDLNNNPRALSTVYSSAVTVTADSN